MFSPKLFDSNVIVLAKAVASFLTLCDSAEVARASKHLQRM